MMPVTLVRDMARFLALNQLALCGQRATHLFVREPSRRSHLRFTLEVGICV